MNRFVRSEEPMVIVPRFEEARMTCQIGLEVVL